MNFRTLLRIARLSPNQLADRAGVHRTTVYRIASENYSRLHWGPVEKVGLAINDRMREIGETPISLTEFHDYCEAVRDKTIAASAAAAVSK